MAPCGKLKDVLVSKCQYMCVHVCEIRTLFVQFAWQLKRTYTFTNLSVLGIDEGEIDPSDELHLRWLVRIALSTNELETVYSPFEIRLRGKKNPVNSTFG